MILELEDVQRAARCGCQVFLKAECLQRAGSFKIRGAYNKLATLDPAARARGVVRDHLRRPGGRRPGGARREGLALYGCAVAARGVRPRILPSVSRRRTRTTRTLLAAGWASGAHPVPPDDRRWCPGDRARGLTFEVMRAPVDSVALVADAEIVARLLAGSEAAGA